MTPLDPSAQTEKITKKNQFSVITKYYQIFPNGIQDLFTFQYNQTFFVRPAQNYERLLTSDFPLKIPSTQKCGFLSGLVSVKTSSTAGGNHVYQTHSLSDL